MDAPAPSTEEMQAKRYGKLVKGATVLSTTMVLGLSLLIAVLVIGLTVVITVLAQQDTPMCSASHNNMTAH